MKIVTRKNSPLTLTDSYTSADRQRAYRQRKGQEYREKDASRKRTARAAYIPEFVGVDSEGIGQGPKHRAVLLGVGEAQYVCRQMDIGLQYQEVFSFLYSQYKLKPKAAYVGFYLGYDFNQWLRSLPRATAWLLLSKAGRAKRRMTDDSPKHRMYHPVYTPNWDIDMLGFKRLSIRPHICDCPSEQIKCVHEQEPWMHICDAGSFFQMSFARTCSPDNWKDPICTQEEWDKLFKGKERRATAALDTEMMEYNVLENQLLSRCMNRLASGFNSIGIRLAKDEWYGPGATASKWLSSKHAPKHRTLTELMPDWFDDTCRKSYYGGWFEIFSHGIIKGTSYNYDINNAYPYATSQLPHICAQCSYSNGKGTYKGSGKFVLMYGTLHGASTRVGPLPYRDKKGNILRPSIVRGWYWKHEIDAANRAGLVKRVFTDEWVEFIPCSHPAPFTEIRQLYDLRLSVGKNTAQGMAIKLNNNSCYGKFAQSTGSAPFNNWFYASFITSLCRTQILAAISSHPGKADSLLMVATDGVCFDSPHPGLAVSKQLGEWDATEYTDLCLFKPGVYWHKEGKEALLKVKSRGVPKAEFMEAIVGVEEYYQGLLDTGYVPEQVYEFLSGDGYELVTKLKWPSFYVPVNFRMKSCAQAINERKWERAGQVQESVQLLQDSDPQTKRRRPYYNVEKRRIDTIVHDLSIFETQTKYYGEIKYEPSQDMGFGYDGHPMDAILEVAETLRSKPIREEDYEWTQHEYRP
jgi:DNA polymerase type B, organellar and viral